MSPRSWIPSNSVTLASDSEKENLSKATPKSFANSSLQKEPSNLTKKVTIVEEKAKLQNSVDKKKEATVQRESSTLSNQPSKRLINKS
jgi:hypothetical protein